MAVGIQTIFLVVCILLWCSNALSRSPVIELPPKCSEFIGVQMSQDIRIVIYIELIKRLPSAPKYSCDLEEDAVIEILYPNRMRTGIEVGRQELSYRGPSRPTFIKDVMELWSPTLEKMGKLKGVGCVYRAIEEDTATAELACVFQYAFM
ncbi:hypothetical protein ANCCAN_01372 [Ancylostoma caninum]|uniref:SCP domain-containing protein n=1 Tax=Ancylostoma caninum TaxID=29170 RepID=A0A368HAE3_ANCCA|nr:hypothetical protein ANCCAN_01372 [Ancylostoma caninum]